MSIITAQMVSGARHKRAHGQAGLTAGALRQILAYDPDTGVFTFMKTRGGMRSGAVAGHISRLGYREIRVCGVQYQAQRLAWLYIYGQWPSQHVDHRNLSRDDNRISNLRECTRSENKANSGIYRNNRCGVKGVTFRKSGGWQARIRKDGILYNLGYFPSKEEAGSAYSAAAERMYGEFSRSHGDAP